MAKRQEEVRRGRAPYLGPERRRPMFLDAAAAAFAADGYRGASLAEIAAQCGVVKAVLYDCFPGGKAELHAEVLARAAKRFTNAVTDRLDAAVTHSPGEAIVACARGLMAFADECPAEFRLLFSASMGGAAGAARVAGARGKVIGELARRALFVLAAPGRER